jgi:hypothetical protein
MNATSDRATVMSHLGGGGRRHRDSTDELSKLVTNSNVLAPLAGRLGPAARFAAGPVTAGLASALSVNLGDVILWGWQTHHALRAAATATLPGTGPPQHVGLATHQIRSEHHPQVDVIVDEQPPMTITLDLWLVFKLDALLLTVQGGRLVGMSPAGCQVDMTLGARGMNVTRSKKYTLPELVQMGSGLRLLPATAYGPIKQ